jgi:hypothetical protein
MPKMYHPERQETHEVDGPDVREHKADGWIVVGERPPSEYVGLPRDQIVEAEDGDDES